MARIDQVHRNEKRCELLQWGSPIILGYSPLVEKNQNNQTNKTVVATSTCCREEPFPLTLKLSSTHTPKPINKTQNPTQSHIYTCEINIWRAVHIYWLCTVWKHFETDLLNVPLFSHPACTLHSLFSAPLITYFCAVFTTWLIPTSPLNSVNSFYPVILGFISLLWPTTPRLS